MRFEYRKSEVTLNDESDTLNVSLYGDDGRYVCFMRSWDAEFYEAGPTGLEIEINSQSGLITGKVVSSIYVTDDIVRVELRSNNRLGMPSVEVFGVIPLSMSKIIRLVVEGAVPVEPE